MKAKLVKHESGFILYDEDNITIGAEPNVLSSDVFSKLSLKNCQAIERGYDLDKLAYSSFPNGTYETSEIDLGLDMYKLGFQKALDLMGDKKFSEEDINNAMNWIMTQYFEFYEQPTTGRREHYIQSLQQTEWEVTYNLEELDADGCLILKRI